MELFLTIASAAKGLGVAGSLAAGGTALSTLGKIKAGNDADAAAKYQARQLEAQGKAELAASAQQVKAEGLKKDFVLSRARTVAAASGGGQDVQLLGDIEEEGTYRKLMALWTGEEAMKGRNQQAATSRFEGRQAKSASRWQAASTLLSGGASLYDKYAVPAIDKYGR